METRHERDVKFKTDDVDLAAYLALEGYVITSVELSESGKRGEFVLMDSPGLAAAVERWRFSERRLKEFATLKVQCYRWASHVVRSASER